MLQDNDTIGDEREDPEVVGAEQTTLQTQGTLKTRLGAHQKVKVPLYPASLTTQKNLEDPSHIKVEELVDAT